MPLLFREVIEEVHKNVPQTVMDEFLIHLNGEYNKKKLNLWGKEKSRSFIKKCLYIGFYHDIKSIGYSKLASSTSSWLKLPGPTIDHNLKQIRKALHDHVLSKMQYGSASEWDRRANRVEKSNELEDVNLWCDSTDFPLKGSRKASTKDLMWSYKLNKLGLRFLAVFDAKGEVRFISPGYSPKIYDGHWLDMNRPLLEEKFKGATVIADTHFEKGESMFNNLSFKTPIREPRGKKRRSDGVEVPQLNQGSESYNRSHKRLRSRVELPFARMEQIFSIVSEPFYDGEDQLEYLIMIGCGIINRMN